MNAALISAAALVASFAILAFAGLRAWRGWLDLKRLELGAPTDAKEEATGLRIELAAVRERLRRLERIADGVEF